MADKLISYYDEANKLGGLKAKMRLAVLTAIPSSKAASEPDSPGNIQKFEQAMREIRKEF
ncbi:MAG: hypothetical protein JW941_09235 [Candidatus Coatesbacteria bacterium]|nr:hypothetical protein [Candidatus Coatesbacteria bacterium]